MPSPPHRAKKAASISEDDQGLVRRFAWEIDAINVHLEEVRQFWARTLGISGPQWMILTALADLDEENGVAVNAVAKMLHVDPSFVTTQSKLLEKRGLLRRRPSTTDARVVEMSLSDKTRKHFANLLEQQKSLHAFIFEEFDNRKLQALVDGLAALKARLEKARVKLALDL